MNQDQVIERTSVLGILKKGNTQTKLSFLVMGIANLLNGQLVKGILFLVAEIGFIFWLVSSGVQSILGLRTLGTQAQGWVMDESLGIQVRVPGDNSMLMLIYGLASIMIVLLFLLLYRVNVKSAYKVEVYKTANRSLPSFTEDVAAFLDQRFHVTLMTIPLIGVMIFTILPLAYMILLAFTSYDHNHLPPKNLFTWVGLQNFSNILTGRISGTFFPLLGWTLIWAFFATATCFFFGILLAMLINKKGIKGKKVFRTLFVTTMAVPHFISLLIMQNMLHSSGPVNSLLKAAGIISESIPFLTDGFIAKISIIVVNMWIGIPVTMLVTTGILMNLPQDQIEAAKIDGANKFQIFKNITFPQIVFIMAPSLIQQFIGNINNFNVIFLLTGGGPLNSDYYNAGETDLLVTWLYKLTVEVADYNLASVIGIITFVLSAVFSLILYTRSSSYKTEGELN